MNFGTRGNAERASLRARHDKQTEAVAVLWSSGALDVKVTAGPASKGLMELMGLTRGTPVNEVTLMELVRKAVAEQQRRENEDLKQKIRRQVEVLAANGF